jgi:outer membrane protein assembly factor BamB
MTSARDIVLRLIKETAITYKSDQRIISPSGAMNNWLIDMRRVFLSPDGIDAAADLFWDAFQGRLPFQVGGMEVAAVPLVTAILLKGKQRGTPVNGFILRKERKTSGLGKTIEGKLTADPIVIVDDIVNSASSLEKIRVVLDAEGRKMGDVFALVDYRSKAGGDWRTRHGISITAPFTPADLGLALSVPKRVPPQATFTGQWIFSSPDPNFFHMVPKSTPVLDDKCAYFGSDCGVFWAVDLFTGRPVWQYRTYTHGHKNIWSSPALHGGRVYFGSYSGQIHCLETATGAEVWRTGGCDWVGSSPALAPDLGLLFIGLEYEVTGRKGGIAAYAMETGEKVWEFQTKRYTHASPAYWADRSVVACGSNDNELFLFDAKTGKVLWRFQTDGEKGAIKHAPAFDTVRGHVLVPAFDGTIYVIDVNTGLEVFRHKTDAPIYTVPLIVGDSAYVVSTDKYLHVLDLNTGKLRGKIYAGAKLYAPPRLINGRIYFAATNGVITEIDPDTLDITGKAQMPDAITCGITHSPRTGFFYALTYVQQLIAFKREEPKGEG